MSRKMSIAKQIQVQKKQDKNRMVGETFNPTGITSQEIQTRSTIFYNEFKNKCLEERKAYWINIQDMLKVWRGSWPWEWCEFKRNFIRNNEVI